MGWLSYALIHKKCIVDEWPIFCTLWLLADLVSQILGGGAVNSPAARDPRSTCLGTVVFSYRRWGCCLFCSLLFSVPGIIGAQAVSAKWMKRDTGWMNIYSKLYVLLEKIRQENSVLRLLGHPVKRETFKIPWFCQTSCLCLCLHLVTMQFIN